MLEQERDRQPLARFLILAQENPCKSGWGCPRVPCPSPYGTRATSSSLSRALSSSRSRAVLDVTYTVPICSAHTPPQLLQPRPDASIEPFEAGRHVGHDVGVHLLGHVVPRASCRALSGARAAARGLMARTWTSRSKWPYAHGNWEPRVARVRPLISKLDLTARRTHHAPST